MKFNQSEINLHTHSRYCRHGTGELSDFAFQAKQRGNVKVLGFSEHCPIPMDDVPSRMPIADFQNYIDDIYALRKPDDDMIYLVGAECDYIHRYLSFYKDFVVGKKNFDYVLGGVHFLTDHETGNLNYIPHMKSFDLNDLKLYAKWYIEMLENGLFEICCHPDLFFGGYKKWDAEAIAVSKDIIACSKANNKVLEINDLGLRKKKMETPQGLKNQYTIKEFWELAASSGVKICTNSDAHTPDVVFGTPTDGYLNASFKFAAELGITFVDWDVSFSDSLNRYVVKAL